MSCGQRCPDPLPLAARDPRPAYFSLAGVPEDLLYVPACKDITSVAQIMELWERGPDPSAMSALVKGVARIPFSQLQDMPQGRWRGMPEMKRVKWEINPGVCASRSISVVPQCSRYQSLSVFHVHVMVSQLTVPTASTPTMPRAAAPSSMHTPTGLALLSCLPGHLKAGQ